MRVALAFNAHAVTALRYVPRYSVRLAHKLIRFPITANRFIAYVSSASDSINGSKSLTALFGMRHLTYGTNFLLLFAFLVSRPPQSALLHCHASTLLLNRWLACFTGSSTLVLKHLFSRSFPPYQLSSLSLSNRLISRFLSSTYIRKSLALKILVSAAD